MTKIRTIIIEFKNNKTLVIQDVLDYKICMPYFDIYADDKLNNKTRHYHIDICEIRYWEVIVKEVKNERQYRQILRQMWNKVNKAKQ